MWDVDLHAVGDRAGICTLTSSEPHSCLAAAEAGPSRRLMKTTMTASAATCQCVDPAPPCRIKAILSPADCCCACRCTEDVPQARPNHCVQSGCRIGAYKTLCTALILHSVLHSAPHLCCTVNCTAYCTVYCTVYCPVYCTCTAQCTALISRQQAADSAALIHSGQRCCRRSW
jgi:hypothetical protein